MNDVIGFIVTALVGVLGGGGVVFALVQAKQISLAMEKRRQVKQAQFIEISFRELKVKQHELHAQSVSLRSKYAEAKARLEAKADASEQERARAIADLKTQQDCYEKAKAEFDASVISYQALQDENTILKDELLGLMVNVRKTELDVQAAANSQLQLDEKCKDLAERYLKENVKWIGNSLNQNNFVNCKLKLQNVIESCRNIGFEIPSSEEHQLLADLRTEYEKVVRAAFEREEQARIRSQIREELLRAKEIDRQLKQLERERDAVKAALDRALAEADDQHSEEVERLRAMLAEAEARSQRAVSQAQLTRTGHVYVISNIGSFGEGVFKIGMTRRLEPLERVYELGGASVPFPFDVHMMIASNDAPTLENALHRKLHKLRINKVNPRREFFRTDIETICEVAKEHHGDVTYIADAEALQYRQTLCITDDDEEFIERVYADLDENDAAEDEELIEESPSVSNPS